MLAFGNVWQPLRTATGPNGGCSADGAGQRQHALEIASHGQSSLRREGFSVVRERRCHLHRRPPSFELQTTTEQLRYDIDWVLAEYARRGCPCYRKIDPDRTSISGFSCGGLRALQLAPDPQINAIVVHNFGFFSDGADPLPGMPLRKSMLSGLHTPVLYILGGPKDMAFNNGMDSFRRIDHVPAMLMYDDSSHDASLWNQTVALLQRSRSNGSHGSWTTTRKPRKHLLERIADCVPTSTGRSSGRTSRRRAFIDD